MLPATEAETQHVRDYMKSEAPDRTVQFLQKVYSENVLHIRHDVWDVHTDLDRWWVITEPMNLYPQDQFPNMDLAVTFHIGLCLRIPRTEQQKLWALPIEPFAEGYRYVEEAVDALSHAFEVSDYQAIGVRCREALLAFMGAAQVVIPWTLQTSPPKKADLKAWADHVCGVALSGSSREPRRHLFKAMLEHAWKFANWLTHAKSSRWHDAEAAIAVTSETISLCTSAVIQHIRGVPAECPACGSHRLSPERGYREDVPELEWERPTCDKCGWAGEPVQIQTVLETKKDNVAAPSHGECVIQTASLRQLSRPK